MDKILKPYLLYIMPGFSTGFYKHNIEFFCFCFTTFCSYLSTQKNKIVIVIGNLIVGVLDMSHFNNIFR